MAKEFKQSTDRELFDAFFPGLVDDVVKESENDKETGDAVRHMREVSYLSVSNYREVCLHLFSYFVESLLGI